MSLLNPEQIWILFFLSIFWVRNEIEEFNLKLNLIINN